MAQRVTPSVEYLRYLLYGYPGSYKTRTLGTAASDPRTAPCLWLDAGGNPVSIRDYEQKPDIIRVQDLVDYNAPYDWIARGQPNADPLVKMFDLHPPYRSIVIDQLTQTQRMYFDKVMVTGGTGPGDIVRKREWDHYNKVLYSMIHFAGLYYSLPIHVFMTAQEREGDPDSGRPIGPALEGQSAVEVGSYAEAIGRLIAWERVEPALQRTLEKEYGTGAVDVLLVFRQGSRYTAKNQYGGSPFLVNPTIATMLDDIGYTETEQLP